MKISKFLILILVVIGISCSKEENNIKGEEKDLEVVLTIEVINDGGVNLKGNYEDNQITSAGFYVAPVANFSAANALHLTAEAENSFSAVMNSGIVYNHQYFVRAYVKKQNGQIIESEEKSFVSLGGKSPEISSVDRSHLKDTAVIKGQFFGDPTLNSLKVYFDQAQAQVVEYNDSLIKSIVPTDFEGPSPVIRVVKEQKEATFSNFNLFTPEIESASQNTFALGDTISLYGNHFDTEISRTKILLDGKPLQILATARDSISFILPLSSSKSDLQPSLFAQKQEVPVNFLGKFEKPIIEKLEGNFRTYDTIVISGTYFSPLIDGAKVTFDGLEAQIISAAKNQIKVLSPLGPYKDDQPDIVYEIMDYSITPDEQIAFTDPWLFKAETEYEFYGNTDQHFTKNGKLYLIQKNYGDYNFSLLEFDPNNLTFNHFEIPLPETHLADYPFQVAQDEKSGKIYILFNSKDSNFYELSLDSQSFTSLKDYPAIQSNRPVVFISSDQLFVTGGWVENANHTNTTYDELTELWAYDFNTNSWNQRKSQTKRYSRSGDVMFQNEDDTFISYGLNTSNGKSLFKYSSISDEWENLNSNNSAEFGKAFFIHDQTGYAYFADPVNGTPSNFAYKYNLDANSWESIQPLNNRYYHYFNFPRNYAAFKVNGKIFIAIFHYPNLRFFEANLKRL